MPRPIGLTTTIPPEILFAAGYCPVDLNNVFVAESKNNDWVSQAERDGFPAQTCAWIKGLYTTLHKLNLHDVVGIVEGDCAETKTLGSIWKSEGITVYPFVFPSSRDIADMARELDRFLPLIGTNRDAVMREKARLDGIRQRALEGYTLANNGNVRGSDLFSMLLLLCDFMGNPDVCAAEIDRRISQWETEENRDFVRLACVGVPTIWSDLWDVAESAGARFVDFETPRQFALFSGIGLSIEETLVRYTYTAPMDMRLLDMHNILRERKIDGVVHYTQSFCHRQIEDKLWRKELKVPLLTLEADRPGKIDERSKTRLEAFIERLSVNRL